MKKHQEIDWWKDAADPRPVDIPAELKRPETMDEKIKRIIATEIQAKALDYGLESLEESEDFDVDDDDGLPESPYELKEMKSEYPVDVGPQVSPEPVDQGHESAPGRPKLFTIDGKTYEMREINDSQNAENGNDSSNNDSVDQD